MNWTFTLVAFICILQSVLYAFGGTFKIGIILGGVGQFVILVIVSIECHQQAKFRKLFQKSMSAAIEKKYGFGFKREEETKSDAEAKGH